MPSAFSLPCQTSFHFTPASMIPGIAVIVTSLGGGGCGKVLGAVTGWDRANPRERADLMGGCVVEVMMLLYRVGITLRERRSQECAETDGLADKKKRPVELVRKSSRCCVPKIPNERDYYDQGAAQNSGPVREPAPNAARAQRNQTAHNHGECHQHR